MKRKKEIGRKLLFLVSFVLVCSLGIAGWSYAGNSAIHFPASSVSTATHNYWYSMVSLADPRLNPAGFDYSDTSFTVEAWIKPEKEEGVILSGGNNSARITTDGYALYLWKGASTYAPEGCADNTDASCVKFAVKSNGKWYAATAEIKKSMLNEWHHVAGVYDKNTGTLTVYIDGKALSGTDNNHRNGVSGVPALADAGSTFIAVNQTFTPEMILGYERKKVEIIPKPVHWFKGTIDEVRLWTEARTASRIKKCMKQELGRSGDCRISDSLATYLPFNEGQGATVRDMSGHGNNGSSRYYQRAKEIKKDHSLRVGYHTQVQDPESLEILDPAEWVAGYQF
jgi:hypothetical protein